MLCGSLIKIWNLANHMKNKTKNIKMLDLLVKNWKITVWCFLFHFFHVICKISNFNLWTAKHLAQASCTELTLPLLRVNSFSSKIIFYLVNSKLFLNWFFKSDSQLKEKRVKEIPDVIFQKNTFGAKPRKSLYDSLDPKIYL